MAQKQEAKKTAKKVVHKKQQKKNAIKQISQGKAYVKASYNNTIVSITDMQGNVLAWASSGVVGFKGPKKATPYAATLIVKKVAEAVEQYGLKEVVVSVQGIGGGREAAIRALNAHGFNVTSIIDTTPIPHNGCRPPHRRRV
ncbi:MAG TPA: 30S ribosomal protein S11 [Candidatus Magasanikbacteria bacterium]|nr:30S ribosomal protein S11 [Candidatus Magasanikbacteria bacterium]